MNAPVAATPEHRARVLRALGVTPWRHHAAVVAPEATLADVSNTAPIPAALCTLVIPKGCAPRELDLLGRALYAFGPNLARAARIEVGADDLGSVPAAQAYLVFGEAQARALGRALSAEAMQKAQIVLADMPDQILVSAAAKRRLWNALRGLRRALAALAVH